MVCPLTLPVPEIIFPVRTSEASLAVMVHFKVMSEPKGLGILFAVLGWKSKDIKLLGAGSDKAKSQSAWTLVDPWFVMETVELADPEILITSPLCTVNVTPADGTVFPLTLPVPANIFPTMTSEASLETMWHFRLMLQPRGLGML